MISQTFLQSWSSRLHGVLRIVTGFLFIQHGTAKLFQIPHVAMFDGLQVGSLVWVAGVIELIGGALVIIGLFTRPVAFILSGQMAIAYFYVHNPQAPMVPILNAGELAVVWCFTFLYMAAAGGGAWSVDAMRGRA